MNRNPRRKIYDRTQLTKQAQKNRQITGPLRQKKINISQEIVKEIEKEDNDIEMADISDKEKAGDDQEKSLKSENEQEEKEPKKKIERLKLDAKTLLYNRDSGLRRYYEEITKTEFKRIFTDALNDQNIKDYVFDLVKPKENNEMTKEARKTPRIYYIGNSMNGTYIQDVIDLLEGQDFSINVISKSGTTTETAIAFRVFRELLIKKYGKEGAAKRIYATTDKARGALKTLADNEGYETFVIPDDVGGRFSVLTAVGLLPIAVEIGRAHV